MQIFLLGLTFWDDGACSPVPEDLTCDLVWPHRLRVSGTKRHTVKKGLRLHCAVQIFTLTSFRQWRCTESSKHIMFAPNCDVSVIIKPWGVVDGYFYCNMFHRRGCKPWHHPLHDSTRSFSKTSSAWGAFLLENQRHIHQLLRQRERISPQYYITTRRKLW